MNLQERITALMFAGNGMLLSTVTLMFFVLWEGDTAELSIMM
jgi:hypothetical protein